MKKQLLLLITLSSLSTAEASLVEYGRPTNITNSGNPNLPAGRLLANISETTALSSTLVSWSVNGLYAGQIAAVIFSPVGNGTYQITGIDLRTIAGGNTIQTFIYDAQNFIGSAIIPAGSIFGLWQEGCKNPTTDPIPNLGTCLDRGGQVAGAATAGGDTWGWQNSSVIGGNAATRNYTVSDLTTSALGDILTATPLPTNPRVYAYKITVNGIPAPTTISLFGIGAFALAYNSSRRKIA